MRPYDKPALSYKEQIELMRVRGLNMTAIQCPAGMKHAA